MVFETVNDPLVQKILIANFLTDGPHNALTRLSKLYKSSVKLWNCEHWRSTFRSVITQKIARLLSVPCLTVQLVSARVRLLWLCCFNIARLTWIYRILWHTIDYIKGDLSINLLDTVMILMVFEAHNFELQAKNFIFEHTYIWYLQLAWFSTDDKLRIQHC